MEPHRSVFVPSDIQKWEKSEAYQDILGFLMAMNECVKGKKLSCNCVKSEVVTSLSFLIDKIDSWIDKTPPLDQPQRFGNKAFRDFYKLLKENCSSELKEHLPENHHASIVELSPYLIESFGNSIRIDYGTGHELSFIMFLCCLHKIGALTRDDSTATVTLLFSKYISLCRKLQMTYKMEPAGSQGVWSLDDYQFIPFIWGSSQLMMHPKISPEMFTQENIIKEFASEYLFLDCIQYITSVKTGPFAEHSNQLWNISAVQSWSKINQGLFKMYKAEILNKFPIIQHVLFGSILSVNPAKVIKFPPPMEMGSMKSSIGMMSRCTPKPGMMTSSMGAAPPSTCMMPPSRNTIPVPLQTGMMPQSKGTVPLESSLSSSTKIVPPKTSVTSNQESHPLVPETASPSLTNTQEIIQPSS